MGKEKTEKADMEHWLHERIGPAYDALKADPGRAVTADQVRARLADVAQAIELARRVDASLDEVGCKRQSPTAQAAICFSSCS